MEDEEGGMGSETGGDWNRSGVWDGPQKIRGRGIMELGGGEKISTSVWRENGGQTNGHEDSEKHHHGNERAPFLNKSHFGIKLSWAEDRP